VLEELLKKLKVEHVVWCKDKEDMYYEVGKREKERKNRGFSCSTTFLNADFMVEGDISGPRRRALRELHTLPHRDGYRREDELDSEVSIEDRAWLGRSADDFRNDTRR